MNEDLPIPNSAEEVNEPATRETKDQLLHVIQAKAGAGDYHKGIFLFSALRSKTNPRIIYGVTYVLDKDRESNNGALRIATVTKTIPQSSGLDEQTGYLFVTTPDQTIEVEKHTRLADPKEFREHMDELAHATDEQDSEKIMDWFEIAGQKIADQEEARDMSRKVGLSFFSQAEAADLLEEIKQAEFVDLVVENLGSSSEPEENT